LKVTPEGQRPESQAGPGGLGAPDPDVVLVAARILELVDALGLAARHVHVVLGALDVAEDDVLVGAGARYLRALHEPVVGIEGEAQLVANQGRVPHRPAVIANGAPFLGHAHLRPRNLSLVPPPLQFPCNSYAMLRPSHPGWYFRNPGLRKVARESGRGKAFGRVASE
jgi:hypothetical protein